MPPYRLANLSAEQMQMIESLENEIGLTLVAYEPEARAAAAARGTETVTATAGPADDENQRLVDALVETYRSHQPQI